MKAAAGSGSLRRARARAGIGTPWQWLVLVAFAAAACEDSGPELPPFSVETERTRIALDDDYERDPLCRGDLDHIDAHIARVEQLLDARHSAPVSIYLLSFARMDEICGDDSLGCYDAEHDRVFATWQSIDHEIVHAVTRDIDFPSLFWSEGTAELASGITRKELGRMLTPDQFVATEMKNYLTAGHFSRFIVETYGWDAFNRIIRGESLDDVLGITELEVTQLYENDAPYSYPWLEPCPYPPVPSVEPGRWQETVAFTCESPDTSTFEFTSHSFQPGPVLLRSVELEAGEYEFEYDGASASGYVLLGCQTEALDVPPEAPSNGDLYNEAEQANGTLFPTVGRHILAVTDGTYRVALVGAYAAPANATATFTVTRVE
jgi:hypothetical protein